MTNASTGHRLRRTLAGLGLGVLALGALVTACTAPGAVPQLAQPADQTRSTTLPVTAGTSQSLTPAQTEGPYFKANSPERTSLIEPGVSGTGLVISGRVRTPDGQPVAGALLDFWQANTSGAYDNSGYTLRGHQYTDANGQYTLETVMPGPYPGRTRHIHVKVQAPNGPVLTTQLYFPGEARNASDGIFDPALILKVDAAGGSQTARFDFVVNRA
jgi:protocatechuate 3,4-dioxygenase beta subunit